MFLDEPATQALGGVEKGNKALRKQMMEVLAQGVSMIAENKNTEDWLESDVDLLIPGK